MKILYAIQGTGNGHITIARDLLPRLMRQAEVDILISGCQVDVDLPWPVKYRLGGLSFIFGKKGGIDYIETFRRGKLRKLFREIRALPVEAYDLVISDFEPVSAWACYLRGVPCVGFSHQAAVVQKNAPRPPKGDPIGQSVLKYYAPVRQSFGCHYLPYDKHTFTPLIRQEVRQLQRQKKEHYTVYLPAYSDKRILRILSAFPETRWEVFSKHSKTAYDAGHIQVRPVANDAFLQSMATATGVLCGAGFQTPAEVLFLQKKLMVVPMKGQYEQQCNAAALRMLGIPVLKNLKKKRIPELSEWLRSDHHVDLDFPDNAESIVRRLLQAAPAVKPARQGHPVTNHHRFRELILRKIFYPKESL